MFDIYIYELAGNTNDKMSLEIYINEMLEPINKLWLQTDKDLVSEKEEN